MTSPGKDPTAAGQPGRRARNRAARHEQLMTAASEIISSEGLDGLTMQAVADRVDCAVGTIYTYFDSKSSLLTALQIAAIDVLGATFRSSRELWEPTIAEAQLPDDTAALVRLVAFGHLFTTARDSHPREFELLQVLLSTRRRETSDEDAYRVLPHALGLINEFRVMVDEAVKVGAVRSDVPDGQLGDGSLGRTVRWAGALNGALLVSNAAAVPSSDDAVVADGFVAIANAFDGRLLALHIAHDLLLGWGASPERLTDAEAFVVQLREQGRLMRVADDDAEVEVGSGEPTAMLGGVVASTPSADGAVVGEARVDGVIAADGSALG